MENEHSTTRRRTVHVKIGVFVVFALVVISWVMMYRNASRPQLDLTNTGSIAVSAQRASDSFVVHPGQTWVFRYSVGDSLMLFVVRDANKSKTVQLDRAGRGKFNSPVKFKAEVNADGEEITFRFIDGE